MQIIAKIKNGFNFKFGIPRQSGLSEIKSDIIFEPEFRDPDYLRGIENFSHLWLIWEFNESKIHKKTVRPPRLGGNVRVGVFATRSPYRPNPIGLSCVKIDKIRFHEIYGTVITVIGADLMNGTPIYDIKPYLPFSDSHPDACGGFASEKYEKKLNITVAEEIKKKIPDETLADIFEILEQDPRPGYHNDPNRIYCCEFCNFRIKFNVNGCNLTITDLTHIE